MTLRVLDGSQLSDEDVRIINSLANSAPASPHGARTADMMAPKREEDDEEDEAQGDGFAGLTSAGMHAMTTGDISGIGPAMAGLNIPEGQNLFGMARDNWQGHKEAMGGLFNGGLFGSGPNPDTMPNGNPPIPIPPGFEGTPVPIPPAVPVPTPESQGIFSFENAGLGGGGGFLKGLMGMFGG